MRTYRGKFPLAVLAVAMAFASTQLPIVRGAADSPAETQEWLSGNGNLAAQRYSTLTQINTETVKNLGAAWVSKTFDDAATSRVTPVVAGNLLITTAGAHVYAFDARTGEKVWDYSTAAPQQASERGGVPNRQGVAVGQGLVFVGLQSGRGIALDQKTGKFVWGTELGDNSPNSGEAVYAAPVYANGVVFWGLDTVERHIGRAVALDAKTGVEMWRFNTIPGPGEPGHETWPQNSEVWKLGSASVWLAPTVDPELGLVYYGTGNPDPVYGGEVRPGNNLYSCSVLALDIKTGKLKWYYQVIHHDLWEGDIATPLVLFEGEFGGRVHKAVAAMRSDGYLFLLDRETGKPLIPVDERPVPQSVLARTSPTQPFPRGGESILQDCSDWKGKLPTGFVLGCFFTAPSPTAPNVLMPGVYVRYVPMSFSPQTKYFYAQANDELVWFRRGVDPYMHQFDVHAAMGQDKNAYSVLAAIDSRTGKIAWKKRNPLTSGYGPGGWLTTAGGLAFHRLGDGNFAAFDAKTGDVLWQFQTGNGTGEASPITYAIDGKQYVAVVASTAVWAFQLGGAVPQAPAPKAVPYQDFNGPIVDASIIETSALLQSNLHSEGRRYWVDRTAFSPYRARVKVGTPVIFTDNGVEAHTIVALDGSWSTKTLHPTENATVTFDNPGTYAYTCKEHPWSYGQIIVVPGDSPEGK